MASAGLRSSSGAARALLALSILFFPAPSPGQQPTRAYVQRPESELLLFEVRLGQTVLADALPAYPVGGGVVVPLGALTQSLEFAISVDVVTGTAEGFFLSENRRFSLDVGARRASVEGRPAAYDAARIEVHQDDIYVDTQLLSAWFPVDLTPDLPSLLLRVRAREPLPVQKRQEREARAAREIASLGYGGPQYPRAADPYRLLDFPFIDQTLRANVATTGSGTRNLQYSTFATGDLLYHEASAYVLGDQHGITDSRFSLGRRDPAGDLLGPLRAREYAGGDVLYPGLGLISLPRSGPGFLVSSFPLQRQTQFDRHTFRGDLPQGWEVELYQNGALIGFQQSRPDGLYEFDNVPLLFGLNVFRLVFYGPQGQRREELSRFNIAESLAPAGQLYYRAVGNDPKDATRRGQLDLDFGISRRLSAAGDLASVEIDGVRHDYGRAALRGYSSLFFADAEVVGDARGGWASGATVQTRVAGIGLNLQYTRLVNGFVSETFRPLFGLIRSRLAAHLDATLPATLLPPIPVSFDYTEDRLEDGRSVDHAIGRVSTFYRGLAVSNFVDWTFSSGEPRPVASLATGDLLVSKFVRSWGLRGEMLYSLQPREEVTNVVVTAERILPAYFLQAGINRAVQARQTHLLASVTRSEGPFGFGVNLDYAHPGGLTAALTLNVSLARDPRSGRWQTQARSLAGRGAVAPLVFQDANGNGIRDSGEAPMEGVGFYANRASSEIRTSAAGTALVTGLPPYQDVDVAIAGATLEDPLAIPLTPGVRVVPRPGHVALLDFPVLISGEITGTVRRRVGDETHEAAGVELQLVDATGRVVLRARSAYDGFYDLTRIVPGEYDLRVSPEQAARLQWKAPEARRVRIAPTGTILDGLDLLIVSPSHP